MKTRGTVADEKVWLRRTMDPPRLLAPPFVVFLLGFSTFASTAVGAGGIRLIAALF